MGDVVEIRDPVNYLLSSDGRIDGVRWKGKQGIMDITNSGFIECELHSNIPPNELRKIFIAWLLLNYPNSI